MRFSIFIKPSLFFGHAELFSSYFGVAPGALNYECDLLHELFVIGEMVGFSK